jgi:hypothetical protein
MTDDGTLPEGDPDLAAFAGQHRSIGEKHGLIVRFLLVLTGFPGSSIRDRIFLQLMTRVKWMNHHDRCMTMICDQISRRCR